VRMRVFRPFPAERVRKVLGRAKKLAVLDRNISFGMGGIWAQEIRNALYPLGDRAPMIDGYVAGLGGRDLTRPMIREILLETMANETGRDLVWKGLKPRD